MSEAKKNFELLERYYRVSKKGTALHEVLIEFVTLEDLVEAIKALEEIQQFRAIGTVEELQAIKQWKSDVIEDFCKYDVSSFEELIRNSRNKAIDEFTERLKDSLKNNFRHLLNVDTDGFEWLTTDAVGTHIDKIAEQLKGGAE